MAEHDEARDDRYGASLRDDGEDVVEEIAPRTIRFPAIEWNNRTLTEITLRPLTVGMILDAQGKGRSELEQTMRLIKDSSGQPEQVVRLLPPQVFRLAGEYFARFLEVAPPKAGDAPPPA